MPYRIIAAMGRNHGIGYNGNIPWNIPADMRLFTKLTIGLGNNAIIMGNNTWQSLNCKPLKKRDNIVLSKNPYNVHNKDYTNGVSRSISDVIALCNERNYDDIWIIGGEKIYRQFLNKGLCSSCHLTYIDTEYPSDTFFPINLCYGKWITETVVDITNYHDNNDNDHAKKNKIIKVEQHIMIPGDSLLEPLYSFIHHNKDYP